MAEVSRILFSVPLFPPQGEHRAGKPGVGVGAEALSPSGAVGGSPEPADHHGPGQGDTQQVKMVASTKAV